MNASNSTPKRQNIQNCPANESGVHQPGRTLQKAVKNTAWKGKSNDRQSINFIYRNANEEIALEWVTDNRNQKDGPITALTLFEIGFNHVSDIPASIAHFRKVAA